MRYNFEQGRVNAVVRKMQLRLGRTRRPEIALTLGSGLGGFGQDAEGMVEFSYGELGLPVCKAKGHAGVLRFVPIGHLGGVLVFDGRVHHYEGWHFQEIVLAVRAAVTFGCKTHIITCASGGVDPEIRPGSLVLLKDHINLMGGSPLRGFNYDEIGPRFPDMTHGYDPELRAIAGRCMFDLELKPREAVYAAMAGPSYETPAEIRMLRGLGADIVGMSTVPEVLALRHMGARVLGISCVANHGAGVVSTPLSHDDVVAACAKAAPTFRKLLVSVLNSIPA